jgi:hypothetical protein
MNSPIRLLREKKDVLKEMDRFGLLSSAERQFLHDIGITLEDERSR